MKKFAALVLLVALGLSMSLSDSQAAWKKRGWYMKKPGANCVMRKVVTTNAAGQVVVQKVRVCS